MNLIVPVAAFLLAFIPRAVLVLFSGHIDPGWSPHWNLASGLMQYGIFGYHGERVTNIEPGYPFFIAAARWFSQDYLPGTLLIQAAIGALGAVFLYFLALRILASKRAAFVCSMLYALYPYLIGQSISIIEVTVFTTLLIASAYFYVRLQRQSGFDFINSALCGMCFGLTLLTRSMILPAFVLGLFWLLLEKKIKRFAVAALFLAVTAGPWFLRNYSIDGSWIPPRGGWNLLQGNCPYSAGIIPAYNPDLLDGYVVEVLEKERPDLIEIERETDGIHIDQLFRKKAFEFMVKNPWSTLKLRLKNIIYLFYPRIVPFNSMDENTRIRFLSDTEFEVKNCPPRGVWKELAYSLTYTPIFLLACWGVYSRRRNIKEDMFFYFIVLNFIAVYALCWPATRLRVPMDFILMIFAAHAVFLWNKKSCPAG